MLTFNRYRQNQWIKARKRITIPCTHCLNSNYTRSSIFELDKLEDSSCPQLHSNLHLRRLLVITLATHRSFIVHRNPTRFCVADFQLLHESLQCQQQACNNVHSGQCFQIKYHPLIVRAGSGAKKTVFSAA